ncbi:MAG: hypothetical protein K5895_03900 [Lachnospiraceae bacterium]|nr:hypothetical protein [Lachnospiraceae bacterium]
MQQDFTQHMQADKKEILDNFAKQVKGLSPAQAIPLLLETKKTLEKRHLMFSQTEILDLLTYFDHQKLSAQEQMVLQVLKQQISS